MKETIKLVDFIKDVNDHSNIVVNSNKKKQVLDFFEVVDSIVFDKEFLYTYEDEFEQRGDGSGYETFYIFSRNSDGKYFTYYIYDGMIEMNELEEATKTVKTVWDFECSY